jgi:hypothetical protein
MAELEPRVTLQRIRIEWTKASRGAPGAARRAAIDDAFPLPGPNQREVVLVHDVVAREEDGFVFSEAPPRPSRTLAANELDPQRGYLEPIAWRASPSQRGDLIVHLRPSGLSAPRCAHTRAFLLSPGQWGRVLLNERFGLDRGWRYSQTIVNIAFCRCWSTDLFTTTSPTHVFDARARLR